VKLMRPLLRLIRAQTDRLSENEWNSRVDDFSLGPNTDNAGASRTEFLVDTREFKSKTFSSVNFHLLTREVLGRSDAYFREHLRT